MKKEGVGVSEDKRKSGPISVIERELGEAIEAGKAPQFEVQSRDFHNSFWSMGEGDAKRGESRLQMTVSLLLDGQPIVHAREQAVRQSKRGIAYEGRMGSIDIMETTLREAIVLRWPEIGPELAKIKTASYAVHAVGAAQSDSREEHHIQVHFRVVVDGCQEPCIISREGVDSIGLTFEALVTVYHWFIWRVLRRLRGEARKSRVQNRAH